MTKKRLTFYLVFIRGNFNRNRKKTTRPIRANGRRTTVPTDIVPPEKIILRTFRHVLPLTPGP